MHAQRARAAAQSSPGAPHRTSLGGRVAVPGGAQRRAQAALRAAPRPRLAPRGERRQGWAFTSRGPGAAQAQARPRRGSGPGWVFPSRGAGAAPPVRGRRSRRYCCASAAESAQFSQAQFSAVAWISEAVVFS